MMVAPTPSCVLVGFADKYASIHFGSQGKGSVLSSGVGQRLVIGTAAQVALLQQGIAGTATKDPVFNSLLLLQKVIEFLTPIAASTIVYYQQSNRLLILEVYQTFMSKLSPSISAMQLISHAEKACYLLQLLVAKRILFPYENAHSCSIYL